METETKPEQMFARQHQFLQRVRRESAYRSARRIVGLISVLMCLGGLAGCWLAVLRNLGDAKFEIRMFSFGVAEFLAGVAIWMLARAILDRCDLAVRAAMQGRPAE